MLGFAVVMDISSGKISNRLIFFGLVIGSFIQIIESGWIGIVVFLINISIPIILCYLLFLMRALGAGDIKLFSVIGSIWGMKVLFCTIVVSFLIAAGMSFIKLLYYHNLISRLYIFGNYIRQVMTEGKLSRYPVESQGKHHIIHFSIAILIGYLITLEVAY